VTFSEINKSIRQNKFAPVYFLHGEEDYFIDSIAKEIDARAIPEADRAFNLSILYGKDTDIQTILDTARRYPMFADRQLLFVKEAQDLKGIDGLVGYVEKPVPSTVLVICHKHKKLDGRSKLSTVLTKSGAVVYESKKLYDNQLPDWVADHAEGLKLKLQPQAAALIAEYLGSDLSKVANELDKLALNFPEGTLITTDHVQDQIGISKDYNVFEFQKALGLRQTEKAFRIVQYFIANPKNNPLVVVIAALYNYFSVLYMMQFLKTTSDADMVKTLKLRSEFFLKEYKEALRNYNRPQTEKIIHLLKEYDLRSKGMNNDSTSEGELLRELTYQIVNLQTHR
jgi:DNA polymerase III subunit delta